jgi:serine/threonine protein kinase
LLAALAHENIVRIVGVVTKLQPTMILLELMSGDLRSWLLARHKEQTKVSSHERSRCCLQIASALAYLAEHNVIHRDVAARLVCLWCCNIRSLVQECAGQQ